ncbi:MAG: hypothetical protein M3Q23_07295, partial [Actinomycetota bacterium]|nr:hypothetical protein [Actinomycetota bacterium]
GTEHAALLASLMDLRTAQKRRWMAALLTSRPVGNPRMRHKSPFSYPGVVDSRACRSRVLEEREELAMIVPASAADWIQASVLGGVLAGVTVLFARALGRSIAQEVKGRNSMTR